MEIEAERLTRRAAFKRNGVMRTETILWDGAIEVDCQRFLKGESDNGSIILQPDPARSTNNDLGPSMRLFKMYAQSLAPLGITLEPHPVVPLRYEITFDRTRKPEELLGALFDEFNPRLLDIHQTTSRIAFLEDAEFKGRAVFHCGQDVKLHVDCSDYASGDASLMKGMGMIYFDNAGTEIIPLVMDELEKTMAAHELFASRKENGIALVFPEPYKGAQDIEQRLGKLYDVLAELAPALGPASARDEGDWWKTGGTPPQWSL